MTAIGATKFPVLDADFRLKVLGACSDDEERGLLGILIITGMHISCISKPEKQEDRALHVRPKIVKEGKDSYIVWSRPKTKRTMKKLIPREMLQTIEAFLKMREKTARWYNDVIKAVCARAGYEGVSSMTIRHTYCLSKLKDGYSIYEMPHEMGCTLNVVARNYSKLREDQMRKDGGGE